MWEQSASVRGGRWNLGLLRTRYDISTMTPWDHGVAKDFSLVITDFYGGNEVAKL